MTGEWQPASAVAACNWLLARTGSRSVQSKLGFYMALHHKRKTLVFCLHVMADSTCMRHLAKLPLSSQAQPSPPGRPGKTGVVLSVLQVSDFGLSRSLTMSHRTTEAQVRLEQHCCICRAGQPLKRILQSIPAGTAGSPAGSPPGPQGYGGCPAACTLPAASLPQLSLLNTSQATCESDPRDACCRVGACMGLGVGVAGSCVVRVIQWWAAGDLLPVLQWLCVWGQQLKQLCVGLCRCVM
jgi:hypothetical protein